MGIYAARFITRAHQRRQELQKLYEPLDLSALDDSDAESDSDIPILSSGAEAALNAGGKLQSDNNPWDDREEIFGLGEEEEDLKRII